MTKVLLSNLRGQEDVQECRVIQRKSGNALDLRVWASPITIGGEWFTIFTISDISHEKRRKVLERIFFHDVMSTAGNLRGFAELLREASPSKIDEFREKMYELSSKLVDEINAQRDLTAAENYELSIHPVPISSAGLLQEIVDLYSGHEVAKERNILIDSSAQQIVFTSDKVLLSRVLSNMVKNALEASTPGDSVKLGCEIKGEEIQFWVHNPGFMPREVQLQIFQRSFSTKGIGKGLGTYSMRLLSERYLKGSVSFTTSKKRGTTFTARYPLTLDV